MSSQNQSTQQPSQPAEKQRSHEQPPPARSGGQIEALVTYLDQQRAAILHAWKNTVESDATLSTASHLTRTDFMNGIPAWLDALNTRLHSLNKANPEQGETEVENEGREHGAHRWQQGYNLREVTTEWGHLHDCLEHSIEDYRQAHSELDLTLLHQVRQAVRVAITASINESIMQFYDMQQAEATSHLHDMERSLADVSELERLRGEALRAASHDLRGGLTVVRGATQLLDQTQEESMRSHILNLVERSVTSLHKMLNDLMDLARLEAGQEQRIIKPFDAALMLQDLCHTSEPLAQSSSLYLRTEGPHSLMVEGDEVKVRRITQNLLLNALKYTEQGGVTVAWDHQDEEHWLLRVTDTGPGLVTGLDAAANPAAQALSTERRTTLRQGEGIGLSIVKRLCELLDARLSLQTEENSGSTFTVVFPQYYKTQGSN